MCICMHPWFGRFLLRNNESGFLLKIKAKTKQNKQEKVNTKGNKMVAIRLSVAALALYGAQAGLLDTPPYGSFTVLPYVPQVYQTPATFLQSSNSEYTQLSTIYPGAESLSLIPASTCDALGAKYSKSPSSFYCVVDGSYRMLSSRLADDNTWTDIDCEQLEGTTIEKTRAQEGKTIDKTLCASNKYEQLSSKQPGDAEWQGMSTACRTLGGISFGADDIFCAVPRGRYSQLTSKFPYDTSYSGMSQVCKTLNGVSYGTSSQFCAVNGTYSQLSSKLPGDLSYTDIDSVCNQLNGSSVGPYCYVKGIYTQLSTAYPGELSPPPIADACSNLRGHSFGASDQFCVVEGEYTQFSSSVSMYSECKVLEGTSYGSRNQFCAVKGRHTQISTSIPSFDFVGNEIGDVCRTLYGVRISARDCAVLSSRKSSPSPSRRNTVSNGLMVIVAIVAFFKF